MFYIQNYLTKKLLQSYKKNDMIKFSLKLAREVKTMANTKTAKKRVKVIAAKTLRNKAYRSSLRTTVKKAVVALENGAQDKTEAVRAAMKKIDCAVTKGILHKNTAARKKSKLALKLNRAG